MRPTTPRFVILATALSAAMAGGGCARMNSIYRADTLPNDAPSIVSIDAKQRVVLANPASHHPDGDSIDPLMRFCAEPPPDVFTAIATSLGVEASASNASSPEAAAKLSMAIAENAATIERTQTVNILREAMYRNCERYLSGAITQEEFIVQAARDQQLIVQVLAVEQITGVARAQSTALTTVAKAAAEGSGDASLSILAEAKKDVDTKRAANDKLAAEATALPPEGPCTADPIATESPPDGVTAEQATVKNAKCAEAAKAVKAAKKAEEYFTLIKDAVAKQGAVRSETQGKLATAALTASEASTAIAENVVDIVRQYQAFDEIGMTCVVKLRTEQDPEKFAFCLPLLEQLANTRAAQLRLEEERLNAERVKMFRTGFETSSDRAVETVWNTLNGSVTDDNLTELANKAGVSLATYHKNKLVAANDSLDAFTKAFKDLPLDEQEALATAAQQQH